MKDEDQTTAAAPASTVPNEMFASDAVLERTVELADGTKHTMYFKEVPVVDFRRHMDGQRSENVNVRAKSIAHLIAASVVEPNGQPAMSVAQASKLKPGPANALFLMIMEINGATAPTPAAAGDDEGN